MKAKQEIDSGMTCIEFSPLHIYLSMIAETAPLCHIHVLHLYKLELYLDITTKESQLW